MNRILSNVAWRFAEQISSYSVTFIVSIIIARILAPEDYGSIAIIMVFITLANIFVQNGFSAALIQKKNADNLDFSSIFYFILAFSTVLYAILFVISPYVALYYNSDVLCPALRVLGLRLIIGTVNTVQQAVIAKKMIFRKNFFSTLGGNVVSGILGLVAAYAGLGLWALIIQNLSHLIVTTIILWYTVKWRPILAFSWRRLKGLLDFGWKLMASALAGAIYDDLRTLIIGKVYSKSDLAYYSRGQQFPQLIMNNVNNAVSSVTFPVLSEKQDNKDDLANSNRRLIQIMSGVISPLLVGLAIVAEPLVHVILTDKWLPCVPFLRVCCIFYWLTCIYNAYLTSYKAIGNSGLALKIELIDDIIGIILIVCFFRISVMAIARVTVISRIAAFFVCWFITKNIFNVPIRNQISDSLKPVLLAIMISPLLWYIGNWVYYPIIAIFIQLFVGVALYSVVAYFLKLPIMIEIKHILNKNNKRLIR